jgi:hypothetical protein
MAWQVVRVFEDMSCCPVCAPYRCSYSRRWITEALAVLTGVKRVKLATTID